MAKDFVHLHLHTEYSLLDGACRIDRLFERAKEHDQKAVAITDHGNMYGVLQFYKEAKKNGIKPIIGCECYLAPRSRFDKDFTLDRNYYHLVLLCKNMQGYRNLVMLVSKAFTEGFYQKPRIDIELLREHHEGLIALSACLAGKIPSLILSHDLDGAEKHILEMKEIFGEDSFYLEMQNHGIKEQMIVNSALIGLSKKTNVPLVATNDVHYLSRNDAKAQSILMCIQTGKTLLDDDRMKFETDEFFMKSSEEMAEIFKNTPEAIENTVKIADMCNVEFDFDHPHLPKFESPDGMPSFDYLKKLAYNGLNKRIKDKTEEEKAIYESRLEYELGVVNSMGFCDYFLIVSDFVNFAKKSGIYVGPGRGSGAGSLAAWCLDITEIDPIKCGLLFERFLNPERVSMPDFDVDFCFERRHEVIEYVTRKYGEDHVSQIVTFSTMAARQVIRDVGRVLGMPYSEVDRLCKRIPHFLDMTLDKAINQDSELKKMCESEEFRELVSISKSLEGMPRNPSIHAAGVVVTDKPLTDYVPIAVNSGMKVTQFTMNEIADLGLLKIDFLGLRYLTIIRDTVDQIKEKDPSFDIKNIPLTDKDTFDMISAGKTAGMFQIESSGMRQVMLQLKPQSIDDITASIALFRPGPKDSIPYFLENRAKEKIEYLTPELEEILKPTYGCIVYQEQVMEIFRKLAGYSFGRADIVRRAVSKKKKDVMAREKEFFIFGKKDENGNVECEGAIKRGIKKEIAEKIFDQMADFANYAFNKSHAASYALLSYRTAYLKCKYPKEYMAAVLTSQISSDKYSFYIAECRKMGISILPPDINESGTNFSVGKDFLRFGLSGIKNVGEGLVNSIITERKKRPFSDLFDFADRMKEANINRKALESLIASGAFDFSKKTKATMLSSVDSLLSKVSEAKREIMSGQMTLFGDENGNSEAYCFEFTDLPEFSKDVLLSLEKNACGIYLSGHPLEKYPDIAEKVGATDIINLNSEDNSFAEREKVRIFALVRSVTLKQSKNGEKMAFVTAEDLTGSIEVIFFPTAFSANSSKLEVDNILVISGEINLKDEEVKIIANSVLLPEEAHKKPQDHADNDENNDEKIKQDGMNFENVSKLYLRFDEKGSKIEKRMIALLEIFPGNTPVYFYYRDSQKLFKTGYSFEFNKFLFDEMIKLLGQENVVPK